MNSQLSGRLAGGIILVGLGLLIFGQEFFGLPWGIFTPGLGMVGLAIVLLVAALVANKPSLAVPAGVLCGVGAMQVFMFMPERSLPITSLWTFIPIGAGAGIMLMGLLQGERRPLLSGAIVAGVGLLLLATLGTVPLWQLGVFFQETNFRLAGSLLLVGLGALVLLKGLWEGRDRHTNLPLQR